MPFTEVEFLRALTSFEDINVIIYQPYTYLIKFKPTGQVYYGVSYVNTRYRVANPVNLWTTYFTSSTVVAALIKEHGVDQFDFEIRHTFKSKEAAVLWETRVLTKFNVASNPKWLNQSNNGKNFIARKWSEADKAKHSVLSKNNPSLGMKGKTHNPETKAKIGSYHKGKIVSEITKQKLRDARSKQIVSADTKAKTSASLKAYHAAKKC